MPLAYVGGFSPRWICEKPSITGASRESVTPLMHTFLKLYNPHRRFRRLAAVEEVVVKVNGYRCYLWASIDVNSREYWLYTLLGGGPC